MGRLPAIARHIYRQQRRGALIWGTVFGTFVWVSSYGYAASYPKLTDRISFARSLGANSGIRAIFGPAHDLETVRGFTGWRCGREKAGTENSNAAYAAEPNGATNEWSC